jgi:hypothetical protein
MKRVKQMTIPLFSLLCVGILLLNGVGFYALHRGMTFGDDPVHKTPAVSGSQLLYIGSGDTITVYPWNLYEAQQAQTVEAYLQSKIASGEIEVEDGETIDQFLTFAYDDIDSWLLSFMKESFTDHYPADGVSFAKQASVVDDLAYISDVTYPNDENGELYTLNAVVDLQSGDLLYYHCVPQTPVVTVTMEMVEQTDIRIRELIPLIRDAADKIRPDTMATLLITLLNDYQDYKIDSSDLLSTDSAATAFLSSLYVLNNALGDLSTTDICLLYGKTQSVYYQSELLVTFTYDKLETTLYINPADNTITGFSLYDGTNSHTALSEMEENKRGGMFCVWHRHAIIEYRSPDSPDRRPPASGRHPKPLFSA